MKYICDKLSLKTLKYFVGAIILNSSLIFVLSKFKRLASEMDKESDVKEDLQSPNSPYIVHSKVLSKNHIIQYQIKKDGSNLKYRTVLHLWQTSDTFRDTFVKILRESEFKAYFWETPPVTNKTADRTDFEFVLVKCTSLAKKLPDFDAFKEHFEETDNDIATFSNLGRDAVLVAPVNVNNADYSHLAAVLRYDHNQTQIHNLWIAAGQAAEKQLKENPSKPLWISASGLGIYWLHVRLDSRPKYYTYAPYRSA